jgi:hypothetical protein
MMTYVRNNGSHLATEALVNFILPFAIKIAHMPGSGRFERYWPRTSHRRVGIVRRAGSGFASSIAIFPIEGYSGIAEHEAD